VVNTGTKAKMRLKGEGRREKIFDKGENII